MYTIFQLGNWIEIKIKINHSSLQDLGKRHFRILLTQFPGLREI
jgi:hypothetical protein